MARRRDYEPSALRTGLVHAALSLGVFGSLGGALGAGIHFGGDPEDASPRETIALFDAPSAETRLALRSTLDGETLATARLASGADEPDLGIEYVEPLVRTANAEVMTEQGSADPKDGIRINGKLIKPGQSYADVTTLGALPKIQDAKFSERINGLTLPAKSADGRAPSDVYARPFGNPKGKPVISIVVGGLGVHGGNTKAAIEGLPPEVTLSFAPDATRLQYWVNQARAYGHEVLIEVPMESHDYGKMKMHPLTLVTGTASTENAARLDQVLSRATGYFGVINYQGSKFAGDKKAARPILETLESRGLALIEDGSVSDGDLGTLSDDIGLSFARASLSLDTKLTEVDIETQFMELELLATEKGVAFGSAFAFPLSIEMTKAWSQQLAAKGIVLAPVSALAVKTPAETVDARKREARNRAGETGGAPAVRLDPRG